MAKTPRQQVALLLLTLGLAILAAFMAVLGASGRVMLGFSAIFGSLTILLLITNELSRQRQSRMTLDHRFSKLIVAAWIGLLLVPPASLVLHRVFAMSTTGIMIVSMAVSVCMIALLLFTALLTRKGD
jgi:polyferredoxin